MKTTYNNTVTDYAQQVQALLCIDAFENLCAKASGRFRIVPLKGIDLIRFLYSETLDRELRDLDVLVLPEQRAMGFIELLFSEGYRAEYTFSLDSSALREKRKVSMLSPSEKIPDIDVHFALIHKKFFSKTINGFNLDAVSRIRDVDEVVSVLDNIDRWMYLASHLTFHYLEGEKWYRDLALLLNRFNENDLDLLISRSKSYNFERIVGAVCWRMQSKYPDIAGRITLSDLLPSGSDNRFLRYIAFMAEHPKRLGNGFHLVRYYWEFIFIKRKEHLHHSFVRLLFPSIGNMQNMYRCHAIPAALLYVPNFIVNALGFLLFMAQYYLISTIRSRSLYA